MVTSSLFVPTVLTEYCEGCCCTESSTLLHRRRQSEERQGYQWQTKHHRRRGLQERSDRSDDVIRLRNNASDAGFTIGKVIGLSLPTGKLIGPLKPDRNRCIATRWNWNTLVRSAASVSVHVGTLIGLFSCTLALALLVGGSWRNGWWCCFMRRRSGFGLPTSQDFCISTVRFEGF